MKTLKREFDGFTGVKLEGMYQPPVGSEWVQSLYFNSLYYNVQYIDLKGVAYDRETVVLDAAAVQRGTYHYILPAQAGDRIYVWDLMTSIPIDIAKQDVQQEIFERGMGMPGTRLNYEHVLFHRMQIFSYDLDMANGTALLADETQIGSLEATASDRIYCYRMVSFTTAGPGASGVISPVRYLLNVNLKDEPEYEYLMRLKRSYELQQVPDVD
jgi:hypothetical protein